ncbi:hypothetical protein BD560DRAFT_451425 [Blakeslea trispora]|nr:hypothetical protein BD560DRAFT_451425 [Blakeslea trispora]
MMKRLMKREDYNKIKIRNPKRQRISKTSVSQHEKENEDDLDEIQQRMIKVHQQQEEEMRFEEEKLQQQRIEDEKAYQQRMLQIAAGEMNDFVDDYSGSFMDHDNFTAPEISSHVQSWVEHAKKVRDWYLNSFLLHGEPDLSKKSVHFEPYDCSCHHRGVVKMTLYFLNAIQEVEVMHCSCNPLLKQLLENQMMPNKTKSPRCAIYFALFDYLHIFKMRGYISNHCFVNICNDVYQGMPGLSSRTALMTNDVLNSAYFLYRKLARYAQDHVDLSYGLESMSVCSGCELVSMDGNFQMKRRRIAGLNEAAEGGFFALSIGEEAL